MRSVLSEKINRSQEKSLLTQYLEKSDSKWEKRKKEKRKKEKRKKKEERKSVDDWEIRNEEINLEWKSSIIM